MEPGLEGREEEHNKSRHDLLEARKDLLDAGFRASLLEDYDILQAYARGWNTSRKHWDQGFADWVTGYTELSITPSVLSLLGLIGTGVVGGYNLIRYDDPLAMMVFAGYGLLLGWHTFLNPVVSKFLYRRLCGKKPEPMEVEDPTNKS